MLGIFLADNRLGKGIGYVHHCHITVLLCINYTSEHDSLGCHSWGAHILFGDVVTLLVATNDLACLDGSIPLLFNKDVGLKYLLLLLLAQSMPMLWLVRVTPMELLHLL